MALTETDVADAVAGRDGALDTIYRALAPRVQRYLWARGADDPEALTNDVFLAVLPRLDRLEGGVEGLTRLVFSVAHARYVDDVRRRSRRPRHVAWEPSDDSRTTPAAESVALVGIGAEQAHMLIGRLRADQRDVIALRVMSGLSLEETARVMDRSVGAVKQLQRRGLLALRAMMEDGGGSDG